VGNAGRLRPHRSECDEEAQLTPHGKRASWSGNQLTHTKIATINTKTVFIKSGFPAFLSILSVDY
jgi:hypothetical protein